VTDVEITAEVDPSERLLDQVVKGPGQGGQAGHEVCPYQAPDPHHGPPTAKQLPISSRSGPNSFLPIHPAFPALTSITDLGRRLGELARINAHHGAIVESQHSRGSQGGRKPVLALHSVIP
jgi:hypothetical protein